VFLYRGTRSATVRKQTARSSDLGRNAGEKKKGREEKYRVGAREKAFIRLHQDRVIALPLRAVMGERPKKKKVQGRGKKYRCPVTPVEDSEQMKEDLGQLYENEG